MKNVEKLISSIVGRSGLINGRFDFAPSHPHVPFGINKFTSIGMNAKYGHGTMIADVDSCGISVNRESALYAMVGEYVERLTCSVFPAASKDIICGSYNDLSKLNHRLLHPNDIILFSNEQYNIPEFPFKKFSVNDEVKWLKCKDFRSDQDIYIPAFLIFLGNGIEKIPYTIPTSTSQAAGRTILDAIKGGYLESAERDAWCKFWFLQKDQAFITYNSETILSSFPGDALLNRLFNNKSIKIKVFDLGAFSNVESVAVFFFFYYGDHLLYTCGASSKFSKREALVKACYEAYQLMDLTINLFESRKQNGEIDDILKSLAGFEDNFNFYNQFPEFRKEVPIFCVAMDEAASHEHLVIFENKLSSLEDLKDKNTDCVSDIFYVDLTINLWDIPFKVVKVVCPNHAQLSPLHQAPFLGSYTSDANLFLHYPNCFP